ncbi:hypothetical protein NKH18_34955 [Streptomyces sp. M10(2022)]
MTVFGKGDYSGDGKPDLLTRDSEGRLWLYEGRGAVSSPYSPRVQVGKGGTSPPTSARATTPVTASRISSPVTRPGICGSTRAGARRPRRSARGSRPARAGTGSTSSADPRPWPHPQWPPTGP